MTLTLKFPAAPLLPPDRQPKNPHYELVALKDGGLPDTYTVTQVHDCISNKARGMRRVYRITMVSEAMNQTRDFVCKVAFGMRYFEVLKEEAMLYEGKLDSLCGQAVPMYYGFFMGETYEGRTGILILEDCGRPLRVPIRRQPLYFRQHLLHALIQVHHAGVDLEDFGVHNVVVTKDPDPSRADKHIPVIIDFSNAKKHKCLYKDELVAYSVMPYPSLVPCSELWRAFMEAEIFYPRVVTFFSTDVPIEYLQSVELLKSKGNPPDYMSQDRIDRVAYRVCKDHRDWWAARKALDEGSVRFGCARMAHCRGPCDECGLYPTA
ncbi:hypothetical protein K466DRAFT_528448 [Polyporus arcularius HHB13444]|uniref:Protein kinase domain-containing protein n=1 Tax=Polyporus arcularius HHB13444 TaxID=1314778 RepID=A0A5C3P5Y8_9APHY|nr:hypothetical protein K466DRAFT_528448 [Polyporus arcularius HHB13444]